MLDILLTVQLVLVSVMVWRCRVLSRPLLLFAPASQSLSDDLPSRSMLVAAAAKQSHQQQRTTQPPVSVFPVPCSGALLPPHNQPNPTLSPDTLTSSRWEPADLSTQAPEGLNLPSLELETWKTVMQWGLKGLTSYFYLWTNNFWWPAKIGSWNGLRQFWLM